MYISSEEGLEKHYQLLTDLASPSSFVNKYPQLLERLEMFWTKKSEWHRVEKITRGNHTNNYAETGIRVIKDIWEGKSLHNNNYSNRLLDIAHSQFRPSVSLRYRELNTLQKNITSLEHMH